MERLEFFFDFSLIVITVITSVNYFTNFLIGLINQELVQFLNAFNIVSKRFDENLHHELRKTFVCLTSGILTHVNNLPRFLASRCLASLASFMPNETITAVINYGNEFFCFVIFLKFFVQYILITRIFFSDSYAGQSQCCNQTRCYRSYVNYSKQIRFRFCALYSSLYRSCLG